MKLNDLQSKNTDTGSDRTGKSANSSQPADLAMKGRFARYDSAFLKLLLPLLSGYRLLVAVEDINPLNMLRKPERKPGRWKDPNGKGFLRYASRNFAAYGMGAVVLTLLTFYSKRTADDIKTLSAEAVGYELGKKPEDVGLYDVLFKSKNSTTKALSQNFIWRSLARLGATVVSFGLPWEKLRYAKEEKPNFRHNLDMGVGLAGLYLAGDGFLRHQTFFEAQQEIVDNFINHVDGNVDGRVNSGHIQSLMFLHRKENNKSYKWPPLDAQDAKNEMTLASRVADLLNQTYNNVPNTDHANLTIGKFNYLVGFGLLDKFPQSLAFLELANKSPDMVDVKAAAEAIKIGQNPKVVFQALGIDMDNPVKKTVPPAEKQPAREKFVDSAPRKVKIAPRSLMDYTEVSTDWPFAGGKA